MKTDLGKPRVFNRIVFLEINGETKGWGRNRGQRNQGKKKNAVRFPYHQLEKKKTAIQGETRGGEGRGRWNEGFGKSTKKGYGSWEKVGADLYL